MGRFSIILILLLITSSCKLVLFRSGLGMDLTPSYLTKSEISEKSHKWCKKESPIYFLDTNYMNFIRSRNDNFEVQYKRDTNSREYKNSSQYVYLNFYDTLGKLFKVMANCHVYNPIVPNWQLEELSNLEVSFQIVDYDAINLEKLSEFIFDKNGESFEKSTIDESKPSMVVVVNTNFTVRYSSRLLKQLRKIEIEDKVNLILVNNDFELLARIKKKDAFKQDIKRLKEEGKIDQIIP